MKIWSPQTEMIPKMMDVLVIEHISEEIHTRIDKKNLINNGYFSYTFELGIFMTKF